MAPTRLSLPTQGQPPAVSTKAWSRSCAWPPCSTHPASCPTTSSPLTRNSAKPSRRTPRTLPTGKGWEAGPGWKKHSGLLGWQAMLVNIWIMTKKIDSNLEGFFMFTLKPILYFLGWNIKVPTFPPLRATKLSPRSHHVTLQKCLDHKEAVLNIAALASAAAARLTAAVHRDEEVITPCSSHHYVHLSPSCPYATVPGSSNHCHGSLPTLLWSYQCIQTKAWCILCLGMPQGKDFTKWMRDGGGFSPLQAVREGNQVGRWLDVISQQHRKAPERLTSPVQL